MRHEVARCPTPYQDVSPCALAWGRGDVLAAAPNLPFAALRRAVAREPPLPFGGVAVAALEARTSLCSRRGAAEK